MSKNKERITGKAYEELIFKIYKELEPHAEIKKNDKILGIDSGIEREIDISIIKKIADHEILMIIQAKDHKKRADIKILGEFDSVIRDVRAARGILICSSGFTATAKTYAKARGIDLCSAYDASVKDWQSEIKIPVLRKHTIITYGVQMGPINITEELKLKYKSNKPKFQLKIGVEGFIMKKLDGTETTFLKEFSKLWSDKKIITTPGEHTATFDAYLELHEDKDLSPATPSELKYNVKVRNYLKLFTPIDYRGIKNFITEKFRPSFVKIEDPIPFSDDKSWQYIENPSELSLNTIRLEVDIVDVNNMRFIRAELKE